MRVINRCSELKGFLRVKEDKLEVSKWVVAECVNLRDQVTSELEQSSIRANDFSDGVDIES